ncbi:MAG TPA: ABC transporter permease, partial [Xanthobacteraceae bacterium]|nr:ABC transporter permease [Xanthobacteraceae bacterium]
MTAAAITRTRAFPTLVGILALVAAIALIEVLIRLGAINRFIVPLPSQIALSFERVIVEEGIPERFWLTLREAFWATMLLTVFGVGIGVLLHR